MSDHDANHDGDRARREGESIVEVRRRRRLAILLEMASCGATSGSPEDACAAALRVLARRPDEIAFALVYLFDAALGEARLAATMGTVPDDLPSAPRVPLAAATTWSLGQIAAGDELLRIEDVFAGLTVFVLPLATLGEPAPVGALVLGTDVERANDAEHVEFLRQLAMQLGRAAAGGRRTQELDAVLRRTEDAQDSMSGKRVEIATLLAALVRKLSR